VTAPAPPPVQAAQAAQGAGAPEADGRSAAAVRRLMPSLVKDVIPFVEKRFRCWPRRMSAPSPACRWAAGTLAATNNNPEHVRLHRRVQLGSGRHRRDRRGSGSKR
jgi:hypothetical protein